MPSAYEKSTFTPEYSNELLRRIQSVYKEDIKHYYPQLKLEKLLDLLEHTEYLFELFLHFGHEGNNKDALTSFIVGCYYLFLIMPQSIQFQSRNKSYGIYSDLKKLYENQASMTNVLLMVKDEIETILEKTAEREINETNNRIVRQRAYSVPDSNDLTEQLHSLSVSDRNLKSPPRKILMNNSFEHSDSDVINEENDMSSPLWTAPPLEPTDQLKLAVLGNETLPPPVIPYEADIQERTDLLKQPSIPELSPTTTSLKNSKDFNSPFQSVISLDNDIPLVREPSNNRSFRETNADRSQTHRKDSYHSVYMIDEESTDKLNQFYDSTDYIQDLQRLQKQSIITAQELLSILSCPPERIKLLLIDLRWSKRTALNHIVAPNVVSIDPHLLWDSATSTPIYNMETLEKLLDNELFNRRHEFEYVVYYTDMKTYMHSDFDYNFTLFYLLTTETTNILRSTPTYLLGGYDKWKVFLHHYAKEYDINIPDYLYRPYDKALKSETPEEFEETKNKHVLEPPSWRPPELPVRIRKRPPPPPPALLPVPPSPPVKPRIVDDVNRPKKTLMNLHSARPLLHERNYQIPPHLQQTTTLTRRPSIPTIERSPNLYVSLSITGLRNLGNTCYINSMLQCLFATRRFRDLFLTSKYSSFLNGSKFPNSPMISNSFNLLFKKMYLNGGCSVVPTSFLKNCNVLRPDLKIPDDQQDTQEFLMIILDRLHDELSNQQEVVNEYPSLMLYDTNHLRVQHEEYKHWFEKSVIGNGLSPIDEIFQGQIENGLQCQRCGHSSFNYSTFYVLSLAIPKPSPTGFSRSKRVKLEDCINMFTNDEMLSGENAWDCPNCGSNAQDRVRVNTDQSVKKKRQGEEHRHKSRFFGLPTRPHRSLSPFRKSGSSSTNSTSKIKHEQQWKTKKLITIKTLNFIMLPPVLVIHLSRFFYDLTKKNKTVITYPLILNIVLKNNEVAKYKLYGIVNHTGNLISGHYTSLVNKEPGHNLNHNQQRWYYFDDEVVKAEGNHGDIDNGISKVSSKDVYVLFYERLYE
ncbi:hypothetical protein NCAS_0G00170 [Naumovozyma castellii]|uniref:ubiquitinyl hydrolase 1 n=1 Tax=Naumovozyma castellii TaxID=27288 RepID=Q875U4_NAUCA|nr:hypothetical protein NCAS_0G00170 [Naumovozyma castellii CBS 4309]AAO32538.1 UBP7 [Naumovozyma castellii]CCC70904.1 hypothetical protein NCAS_0G00170 [Naumovozyma castellii CBS 4309]